MTEPRPGSDIGTSPPSHRRADRLSAALTGGFLIIALLVGVVARPSPGSLPDRVIGDQQLAATGRAMMNADRPALALACVTPTRIRTAVSGAPGDGRFELGSISKGLTGLLFQTMIDRGEVGPEARLGTILPMHGKLADVTLTQLATHTSGLPDTSTGVGPTTRRLSASLTAGNPYSETVRQMLAEAQATPLTSPPGTYSNLGFELLGAALTTVAGVPYPELLRDRVLAPLGMTDTLVPESDAELTDRDLTGRTVGGRRAAAWLGPAITPVGGVRADIADMSRLAQQLLTDRAPGVRAITPRTAFGSSQIGLAWITTTMPTTGRQVVWHNGATGGFSSFVGVDRTTGTGVVILSAVQESPDHVTAAGFGLLDRMKGC